MFFKVLKNFSVTLYIPSLRDELRFIIIVMASRLQWSNVQSTTLIYSYLVWFTTRVMLKKVLEKGFVQFVMIDISQICCFFDFLKFFFYVFFVNGLRALYVNTGCLRWISDMTLSLANNYCIHLLYSKNKISLNNWVLNLNWRKNLLASLSLINLVNLVFAISHYTL